MKVLRVIASMDPARGGPSQGIRNLVPELIKLGCQNEVLCLDTSDASHVRQSDFTIYAIGSAKGPWAYSARLKNWLRSHLTDYDVVIIHGLWLYHGYAVTSVMNELRAKGKKLPICYVMPHGMLDPYFQKDPSRRSKAIRNAIYWRLIEKRVINQADGVLFTCEEELLLARQTFPGYAPKTELNIGYGIQPPPSQQAISSKTFHEVCPGLKGRPYLLFLSRIHQKKGVDLLIHAYAKILSQSSPETSESRPCLVIAGPTDSAYADQMKMLVSELGLSDRVFFSGMLRGEMKWAAFYGCEAFVLPSHQENFGIAVVEALACGKPVLITKQVNIWREIVEASCGLACQDTSDGIFDLLSGYLNFSADQTREMACAAQACFEQRFDVKESAKKFISMIA
jgi:glycosyltransferase involved in cell wall biosynthesis